MKRRILALLLALVMLVSCLAVLTACGGGEEEPPAHEHSFDQKITKADYKKSDATTSSPAVYYYSCSCGEKGTTTFTHGTALDDGGDPPPPEPPIVEYPWGKEQQNVIFQANPNTNSGNLSSGTERYLDGSEERDLNNEWYARIDELVDERNENAKSLTKVNVTWTYVNATQYGWGGGIQYLFETTADEDSPDFYIFFIYDLVSASLKGAFANLFSQARGENYFEFAATGDEYVSEDEEEIGTGYMYKYMRSLTLSKYKMYVLASDYFTDLIRSFFVVPVNADLIASIPVDEATLDNWENGPWVFNSDRTGDGKFDMQDMYKLVYDMDWDYSALIAFSDVISTNVNTTITGWDIGDKLGFALDRASGLPVSGLVYTTTVTVINRDWKNDVWYDSTQHDEVLPEHGDYLYSYPTTNSDLVDLCIKIAELVGSKGVAVVNMKDGSDKVLVSQYADNGVSGMQAIRTRFVDDQILFGGIVNVGAIEDVETYQSMTEGLEIGFGVVPVPLYKSYEEYVEDGQEALCKYQTQIHNNARAGAIGVKTKNFSQLSAYLNYQSLNSSEILEEYYTVQLMLEATGGDQATGEMLAFIRKNVRSSFDKAFEDAIGRAFSEATNKEDPDAVDSEAMKWHYLIKDNDFAIGEGIDSLYEKFREAKETHLKTLYSGYGGIDEEGGLPN